MAGVNPLFHFDAQAEKPAVGNPAPPPDCAFLIIAVLIVNAAPLR